MIIARTSKLTGQHHVMDIPITRAELERWMTSREMIQTVLPHLTPAQREFLLTGITPDEWNATFPPPTEESA